MTKNGSQRSRVLTVGDGDLTLSLALARAYGNQLDLVASTLLKSRDDLEQTYSNASQVVDELNSRGVLVRYGIDATQLHALSDDSKWDAVLFHHPHLGPILDEAEHARRHYRLLSHYFSSARACLGPNGIVHVCLCGIQPETWRVTQAAQRQGLELREQVSTTGPLTWLSPFNVESPVEPHFPAPRKYRNGKLGSKHFLGRYGYRHRRTHGDLTTFGEHKDVNVAGSFHFIFQCADDDGKTSSWRSQSAYETECSICGAVFGSAQAQQEHHQAPALPDPVANNVNEATPQTARSDDHRADTTGGRRVSLASEMNDAKDAPSLSPPDLSDGEYDSKGVKETIDDIDVVVDSADTLISCVVDIAHDGKRLKWFLRQSPSVAKLKLSKSQCEKLIKDARIVLNGDIVLDSGRILHVGDRISIRQSTAALQDEESTVMQNVSIHYKSDKVVVAFKPVGMRTVGSFSHQTLEMAVSARMGKSLKSISKLDTGCGGLCILRQEGNTTESQQVTQAFIALVHGHVSDDWATGISLHLPVDNMRQWRKQGGGNEDPVIDYTPETNHVQSNDELQHSVTVNVVERTRCAENMPSLTTLRIVTTTNTSGVVNAICFLLRKRGNPVVNDRFCRGEYLTLARPMRNLIKNRLLIGCYHVQFHDGADTDHFSTVSVHVPERLSAIYWQTLIGDNRPS